MGFSEITGFFSYAHSDDTFGFLTNLRNDLCDEYRVLTGDELELFFDRDSIEWGERWEKSIEESVDAAGVFLPVVSPCYLASSSCMKELSQYLAKVEKAGAGDLILPLMMIDPSATRGGLTTVFLRSSKASNTRISRRCALWTGAAESTARQSTRSRRGY